MCVYLCVSVHNEVKGPKSDKRVTTHTHTHTHTHTQTHTHSSLSGSLCAFSSRPSSSVQSELLLGCVLASARACAVGASLCVSSLTDSPGSVPALHDHWPTLLSSPFGQPHVIIIQRQQGISFCPPARCCRPISDTHTHTRTHIHATPHGRRLRSPNRAACPSS